MQCESKIVNAMVDREAYGTPTPLRKTMDCNEKTWMQDNYRGCVHETMVLWKCFVKSHMMTMVYIVTSKEENEDFFQRQEPKNLEIGMRWYTPNLKDYLPTVWKF